MPETLAPWPTLLHRTKIMSPGWVEWTQPSASGHSSRVSDHPLPLLAGSLATSLVVLLFCGKDVLVLLTAGASGPLPSSRCPPAPSPLLLGRHQTSHPLDRARDTPGHVSTEGYGEMDLQTCARRGGHRGDGGAGEGMWRLGLGPTGPAELLSPQDSHAEHQGHHQQHPL